MTTSSKPRRLSASQIRLYHQCGLRWKFRYIDGHKEPAPKPGDPRRIGSLFHKVMEVAAKAGAESCTPEQLLEHFAAVVARQGSPSEDSIPCKAILEKFGSAYFGEQFMEPETRFSVELEGVPMVGYLDLVRKDFDGIEIVDWKTGRSSPPSEDEAWFDPQIGIYLAVIHEMHPSLPLKATLVYAEQRRHVTVEWTEELDRYHRASVRSTAQSMANGYTPARVSEFCAWCNFKPDCQAFKDSLEDSKNEPSISGETDGLVEERQRVKVIAKNADAWRKELDAEIEKRMGELDKLSVEGFKVARRSRTMRKADLSTADELSQRLGCAINDLMRADALSITKVDKLAKKKGLDRGAYDDLVRKSTTKYLEVKEC